VTVFDQDWDVPLQGAQVFVAESDKRRVTGEDGSVLFEALAGGTYTLVVTATGFERKVVSSVLVVEGVVKAETVRLNGAFTDMDEFVVKDVDFSGGNTELAQLELRSQNSGIMDNHEKVSRVSTP